MLENLKQIELLEYEELLHTIEDLKKRLDNATVRLVDAEKELIEKKAQHYFIVNKTKDTFEQLDKANHRFFRLKERKARYLKEYDQHLNAYHFKYGECYPLVIENTL